MEYMIFQGPFLETLQAGTLVRAENEIKEETIGVSFCGY